MEQEQNTNVLQAFLFVEKNAMKILSFSEWKHPDKRIKSEEDFSCLCLEWVSMLVKKQLFTMFYRTCENINFHPETLKAAATEYYNHIQPMKPSLN